jgi:hypothetical protein
MVQYRDSFTWSKYSRRLFPNELQNDFSKMMISEMNNADDLFRQNMTEFLQTDIDGSLDFWLNAITIQSLEKYLKTFYMPPLDIDQISSIWDQILCNPKTVSKNAEVSSWWKRSSKSNSSSLHSMIFEDNVGEDGLSAQTSCTFDINDSNYIDNLAPDPTMFDNEVPLGMDTLKKVYTQLISALNDVRIQKVQIQPSLNCGMENLKILILVK